MPSKWTCFVCGEKSVGWEADYSYADWGIPDRDGLVQCYTCLNCGADYEVYIEYPEKDDAQDEEETLSLINCRECIHLKTDGLETYCPITGMHSLDSSCFCAWAERKKEE